MRAITIANQSVPVIGIGTWYMGEHPQKHDQEIDAIQTGINHGLRLIDTAEMYGNGQSEQLVGEAIQPFNRHQLFLVSKVLPQNANRRNMETSLNQSLKRLNTDYLDLYLYHWRGATPLTETISELIRLQKSGKILRWGVSNFDTIDMRELMQITGGKQVATNQVMYNLGQRGIEYDLIDFMKQRDLPIMAYSPVAHGDSLGENLKDQQVLQEIAAARHISVMQLLLAWTVQNSQVMAIPKTSSPMHMLDNIAAGKLILTADELAAIDQQFPKPTGKKRLAIL